MWLRQGHASATPVYRRNRRSRIAPSVRVHRRCGIARQTAADTRTSAAQYGCAYCATALNARVPAIRAVHESNESPAHCADNLHRVPACSFAQAPHRHRAPRCTVTIPALAQRQRITRNSRQARPGTRRGCLGEMPSGSDAPAGRPTVCSEPRAQCLPLIHSVPRTHRFGATSGHRLSQTICNPRLAHPNSVPNSVLDPGTETRHKEPDCSCARHALNAAPAAV
jgi:hypothetical protein